MQIHVSARSSHSVEEVACTAVGRYTVGNEYTYTVLGFSASQGSSNLDRSRYTMAASVYTSQELINLILETVYAVAPPVYII